MITSNFVALFGQQRFNSVQDGFDQFEAEFSEWFQGRQRCQFWRVRRHAYSESGSGALVAFGCDGSLCEVHIRDGRPAYFIEFAQ